MGIADASPTEIELLEVGIADGLVIRDEGYSLRFLRSLQEVAYDELSQVKRQLLHKREGWTRDPENGRGHSPIVMETEQSACALKAPVESRPPRAASAGATNDFLVVTDVPAYPTSNGSDL